MMASRIFALALLCNAASALLVGGGMSRGARARAPPRMAQTVDGVRVGPPPDLPSLLLNERILYLGMPLVPSVTELIVAQLVRRAPTPPGCTASFARRPCCHALLMLLAQRR